jgi:hypothetical protein
MTITRLYGPAPLLLPDPKVLARCIKSLNMKARNAFSEEERYRCRVIRDEIKKLYDELY